MGDELVASLAMVEPDATHLGGKAANLTRLLTMGYCVPPGFVITTEAFANTLEHLGVQQDFDMLGRSIAQLDPRHDVGERIPRC